MRIRPGHPASGTAGIAWGSVDDSPPETPELPPVPPPGFPPEMTVLCQACDGDGWRYAAHGALVDGRPAPVGKQEACLVCDASGRIRWTTGPGASVKRHERKPLPGY
jgi:hypothetical protein